MLAITLTIGTFTSESGSLKLFGYIIQDSTGNFASCFDWKDKNSFYQELPSAAQIWMYALGHTEFSSVLVNMLMKSDSQQLRMKDYVPVTDENKYRFVLDGYEPQ